LDEKVDLKPKILSSHECISVAALVYDSLTEYVLLRTMEHLTEKTSANHST